MDISVGSVTNMRYVPLLFSRNFQYLSSSGQSFEVREQVTIDPPAFVAKNTRLTKVSLAIFALAERLPTCATLGVAQQCPSLRREETHLPNARRP